MELYIDKIFLDNFFSEFNDSTASESQKVLLQIIKEYPEIKLYVDYKIDTIEDLEKLKNENPFLFANPFPPILINSIEDHFFRNDNSCEQTLIFSEKEEDWFKIAELRGVLCFSINNYQSKISEIIKKCHFKVDLSEAFKGWELILIELQKLLPLNKIMIVDNYLLKEPKYFEDNIYPIIKGISKNKGTLKQFFTDIKNNNSTSKEDILKILLNKYTSSSIEIFHNNVEKLKIHDRILYSNFYTIDCPIGFNFNTKITSNSQIEVVSVFNFYTYKRHKNHLKLLNKFREDALKEG